MSSAELQHLVLSPLRFEKLVTAFNGRSLPPAHIRSFTPRMDGEVMDLDTIFLVPGGRFLITRRPEVGIFLWDLGYNADAPAKLAPLAHLPIKKRFSLHAPVPTPDRKGVRLYHSHEFHADLGIVDIYPTADAPEFQAVGSLKLIGARRPRLQAQTSTHIALVIPRGEKIMLVRCPDGPTRPLTWCFLTGLDSDVTQLCGLTIFDNTLVAFHKDKMSAFDMPNFDTVTEGETIQVPFSQSFALPKTRRPYNLYTPEWLGPVKDGFSDIQVFRIESQPEGQAKVPAILPVTLGDTFPVAGPKRDPRLRQKELETCIRGNCMQRSPTALYFTGMVKEPDAPLLLVKYRLPDHPSTETPSEPSFTNIADAFKKGDQWVWIQDVAVCHATGRVVIATPHDHFTGTHEIRVIDYLPPPSSRQR